MLRWVALTQEGRSRAEEAAAAAATGEPRALPTAALVFVRAEFG